MSYIKSYLVALFKISKITGLVFLVGSLFYGYFWALPFVYVSIMAAFGGPISFYLKKQTLISVKLNTGIRQK